MTDINEIASKHLGRASDGSLVKPYITPDAIDESLLVTVPRELNRTHYGIKEDDLPFYGIDAWNCYEFSTLTTNGFPVVGVLRIVYDSDSKYIIESKSMKLYLNSFNMVRLANTVEECKSKVRVLVTQHLRQAIGCFVDVCLHLNETEMTAPVLSYDRPFIRLEKVVNVSEIPFTKYNEDASILQADTDQNLTVENWVSSTLRSNCRVTNQPDWGDVYVHFESKRKPTMESFLQYIVSMRSENHFHEEICECIYKRLLDFMKPNSLLVACLYTRRGGIDINPVRASSRKLILDLTPGLEHAAFSVQKTMRQ